jgi:peptidoglycan/LPS O-acetylase OafA/YrhL
VRPYLAIKPNGFPPVKRLEYVDALRGVAILLVVAVHVGRESSGQLLFSRVAQFGQYGVELFFVMSAFTLCYTMRRVEELTPHVYGAFMLRRFCRIAPMYYLAIPLYYGVFISPSDYNWSNVLANLTFLNGLYPPGNNNIVPGGWSIGCEFLFYFIFPVLFVAARRRRWVLAAAGALCAVSMVGFVVVARVTGYRYYSGNNSFPYFFIANQAPCFILGMAYYFYGTHALFRRWILGLFLPALCGLILMHGTHYGWLATPLCAGLCAVALALFVQKRVVPLLMQRIGILSFSMYILHFYVVHVLRPLYGDPASGLSALLFWCLVVVVSMGAAFLTHTLIENNFIALGRRLTQRIEHDQRRMG